MVERRVCLKAQRCRADIEFVKWDIPVSLLTLLAASALTVCSNVQSIGWLEKGLLVRLISKLPSFRLISGPGWVSLTVIKLLWYFKAHRASWLIHDAKYFYHFWHNVLENCEIGRPNTSCKHEILADENNIHNEKLWGLTTNALQTSINIGTVMLN